MISLSLLIAKWSGVQRESNSKRKWEDKIKQTRKPSPLKAQKTAQHQNNTKITASSNSNYLASAERTRRDLNVLFGTFSSRGAC
ncbi:hypothetical protein ABTL33_19185, partial [Acinetobacter baumannii]